MSSARRTGRSARSGRPSTSDSAAAPTSTSAGGQSHGNVEMASIGGAYGGSSVSSSVGVGVGASTSSMVAGTSARGGGGRSTTSSATPVSPTTRTVASEPRSALQLFRAPGSFRESVRQGLLHDAILGVGDSSSWRVMVLDEHATRVVSSIVGMYDIMEAHVTCVENLALSRQPFPEMEAIYVLVPQMESVRRLCADFSSTGSAMYKSAHVLVLGEAGPEVMSAIRSSPSLLKRLKTFKEISLDFLVAETQVFHLDMGLGPEKGGELYKELYGSRGGAGEGAIATMARRLMTLCSSIKEYPHVRYSADSPRAEGVARDFQQRMNAFVGSAGQDWTFHGQDPTSGRGRATLLVLDRSDDPLSSLMHEFTYQSLAQDVLSINEGRIKYETETKGGGMAVKEALLSDSDDIWVEYRHAHIARVLTDLGERFKALVRNHKGAAQLIGGGGKEMSLQDMAAATRGLPEFQELSKKLSMHMHMAGKCTDMLTRQGLLEAGALEQTMSLGTDEVGKERTRRELLEGWTVDGDHKAGVVEIVSNPRMFTELKLRLIGVFIISQKGISPQERATLIGAAQFAPDEVAVIDALRNLGVHCGPPEAEKSLGGRRSRFLKKMGITSRKHGAADDSEFSHMRYTPPVKAILEKLLKGQQELPLEDFPSVMPLPVEEASMGGAVTRSARAGGRRAGEGRSAGSAGFVGPRIIVFVVGGVTYSEMRAAHELMMATGREIVIGGTSLIAPKDFVSCLEGLAANDSH